MIDEKILQQYENEIKQQQLVNEQARVDLQRQDIVMQQEEKGMISEQLDVSDILDNMYYLLKGFVLKRDESTGVMSWHKPDNNDMIILSDYGVNYILGAVQWYVNKNTLLSNYEEEVICEKMDDFATTLSDNIFMDYENMFCYPTLQDCKDEIERRIKRKIDVKKLSQDLMSEYSSVTKVKQKTDDEFKQEVLKEMEGRIEHEFEVIKQQKLKSKLKRFESIIRFVQDTVHSAYNRAWKGQERRTLREHIQISENRGGFQMSEQKPQYTINPIKAMRGR
jgi:hypothetical protein